MAVTSITPIQKLLQNNFEKVTRKHEGVDTLFFQITTSNGNVFYIKPEGYFHTTTLADSSLLFNVFIEDTSGNLVKTRKLIPDKGTEGLEKNQFYSLALANQQAGTYELEALEKLLQSGHSSPGITAIQSMQEVKCVTFGAARDNIAPQTIDESHDYDIYSKLLVKQSNDSSGHYYGMRFQKNEGKYHIKFTTQTKVVNTENIEELNKIKNNIIENLFLTPAKKNELEAQIASISKEAEKLRVEKRELESALESALESEKGNLSSDQKKKLSELTSTLSPLDKLLSQAQQNLAQKFILSEKEQGEFKKLTIDAQDVKAGFLDNAAIGLAPSCGESAILSAQTEGAGISQTTELEIDDIIALRLIEIFNQDGALIDLTDGEYDKTINALSKKNEKLKNATLFPTGGGALPGFVCRVKCQENIQAELFKSLIPYKDITAAKAIFSREHGNPEIVQPTAMQFPVVATPPRQPRNTRQLTTDMEASIENFTAMIGSGALPTLIADGKITHTRQDDDIILKSKDNEHEYRYRKLTLIQKKAVINNIEKLDEFNLKKSFLASLSNNNLLYPGNSDSIGEYCSNNTSEVYLEENLYNHLVRKTGWFTGTRPKTTPPIASKNPQPDGRDHQGRRKRGSSTEEQPQAHNPTANDAIIAGIPQDTDISETLKLSIAAGGAPRRVTVRFTESTKGGDGKNKPKPVKPNNPAIPINQSNKAKESFLSRPISSDKLAIILAAIAIIFIIVEAIIALQANQENTKKPALIGAAIAVFITALIAAAIAITLYFKNKSPKESLDQPNKESVVNLKSNSPSVN